jgi:hypothetical protein
MIPALSDTFDPLGHLRRGASRKCHQQDAAGVGTLNNQMGNPMSEGVGFSGAGSGDYEQRRRSQPAGGAMLDSPSLLRVEHFEVVRCRLHFGLPFKMSE